VSDHDLCQFVVLDDGRQLVGIGLHVVELGATDDDSMTSEQSLLEGREGYRDTIRGHQQACSLKNGGDRVQKTDFHRPVGQLRRHRPRPSNRRGLGDARRAELRVPR